MKTKILTLNEKEQIVNIIENEGFWYALTNGGYLNPEDVLDKQEDIDKVREAIDIIKKFEIMCPTF